MFSVDYSAWKPLWTLISILVILPMLYLSWSSSFSAVNGKRARRQLLVLRILASAVVVFMTTQAVLLINKVEKIPPRLTFLIDGSPSVADEKLLEGWEKIVADALPEIRQKYPETDVSVALFSTNLQIDSFAGTPVRVISKNDGATRLEELFGAYLSDAVILFTDGRIQDKLRWRYRQGLALFPSGAGNKRGLVFPVLSSNESSEYDIAITEVRADDFAYVKGQFEIKVKVSVNVPNKVSLPVKVYSGGELLATREIHFRKGVGNYDVTLSITPDRAGVKVCEVSLPYMDFEKTRMNNRSSFAFKAVRDRIRVMHIAGRPSWDLRFLRSAMKRDPGIDLVSFYIMRTASDAVNVPNEELSLIEFPYNDLFGKDLESFDVVIFQNFSSRQFFPNHYLQNIAKYVEKGGAFLMLGGDLAFTEGGYAGTGIEEILPVSLSQSPATAQLRKFSLRHTVSGLQHPITEDLVDLSKIPVEGYNGLGNLRKGTVVLLETDKGEPYLAIREAGKGRTMLAAGDGLWGINFSGVDAGLGNRAYFEMVRRMVRWLVKDPALNDFEITDVPARLNSGEEWGIKVKQSSGTRKAAHVKITDGAGKVHYRNKLSPFTGVSPYLPMPPLQPGVYMITAESNSHFIEVRPSLEYLTEEDDFAFVKELALQSGGKVLNAEDGKTLVSHVEVDNGIRSRITETGYVSLWNHPITIILLGLLLGFEWFLRRRNGLL